MIPDSPTAAVESRVPGRIRLRVPRGSRRGNGLARIQMVFENVEGIRNIDINPSTGSVLITHDPNIIDSEDLIGLGRSANVIRQESQGGRNGIQWPAMSTGARQIISGFRQFDSAISRFTGGAIDAKLAIPLLLLGLSLGRALFSASKAPTPWYSLLWYSYSMFMHWHDPTGSGSLD